MQNLILIACFLIGTNSSADNYDWFEIDWISDREATGLANPVYNEFAEEDREKFLSIFGYMRWNIKDGFITSILNENAEAHSVAYSIMPSATDENHFEIILIEKSGTRFYIWRTLTGFCMQTSGISGTDPFTKVPTDFTWEQGSTIAECFKPYEI